jgi:NAD(P)-dependent dehydrogenase (short-subunit alcohol dehydrogenase family)
MIPTEGSVQADKADQATEGSCVSRVFITGSTDGLGRGAARILMDEGHEVVLHARTRERTAAVADLAPRAAGVVVRDLGSAAETRALANQVNDVGRMDAVIHNAAIFREPSRAATAEGHAKTLAVNTLAPYMLTALIDRPDRLIYLSSGMHHFGAGSLRDIDWTDRVWNSATPSIRAWSRPRWAAPEHPTTWRWDTSRRHGLPSAMTRPPL